MKIDLHIHSSISKDGEVRVEDIIDLAVKEDIKVLAIADHERSIGNYDSFLYSKNKDIKVISGAEMFAQHNGKLFHILGYGFDYTLPYIEDLYKKVDAQRERSVDIYFDKIKKAGLKIDKESVFEFGKSRVPLASAYAYGILNEEENRNHPYVNGRTACTKDIVYMCRNYLTVGQPLFGDEYIPTTKEVFDILDKMKAVSVLAHPGYDLTLDQTNYIDEMVQMGLEGLEVYYTTHTKEQVEYYHNYCKEHNLIETCGSDFHGSFKPTYKMGAISSLDNEKLIRKLEEKIKTKNS